MGFGMGMCCCDSGPATSTDCLVAGCSAVPMYWEIDLGGGGWTDASCNYCDEVAGTYILGPLVTSNCSWGYQEIAVCTIGFLSYNVELTIIKSGDKWLLWVFLSSGFSWGAQYEYDPADSPEVSCIGPYTFTKTSDSAASVCNGTMPATVVCQAI